MKNKTQPKIFPISLLNVRIFLVQTQHGYALIDTGIPFHEERIMRAFKSLGVDPLDIHTIILTHGHLDHIGCLAYVQEHSGAVVICHRSLKSTLESGGYEAAVPRVWGWKIINPILSALMQKRLRPIQPDMVVDESLDLFEYGLSGRMLHTPGHSPGSCSILLDSGICFIGDLMRENPAGSYDTGLFYHNRDQILSSLKKIAALKPKLIYLSHGTTMTDSELEKFIEQSYHHEP